MRTTIDFPDELLEMLRSLARDEGVSLSRAVTALLRQQLDGDEGDDGRLRYAGANPKSGFPVFAGGRVVTTDDVRSLEDEW